jgi:hypothetical protein
MTRSTRFALAAFVAAVVGGVVAAFAPLGRSCIGSSAGTEICTSTTFFETEGSWILVVVCVPILVALIPVLLRVRWVRIASAVLLWAGCAVGLISVGLFFVPSAVLMTVAAARREGAPRSLRAGPAV